MYEGVGSRVPAHATLLHGMSWATHVANVLTRIGNVEDYIPWWIWVGSVVCESWHGHGVVGMGYESCSGF